MYTFFVTHPCFFFAIHISLSIYIYISIYLYMCRHAHSCMRSYIFFQTYVCSQDTYTYIYVCIGIYIYICIYMHIYIYIYMCLYRYSRPCVYFCSRICIPLQCITHAHLRPYVYTLSIQQYAYVFFTCIVRYECSFVPYIQLYRYTSVDRHSLRAIYIYIYVYISICICI